MFLTFFGGQTIFLLNWVGKVVIFFISPPCGTFWAQDFCAELQSGGFREKWMLEVHSFTTKKNSSKNLVWEKNKTFFVRGHRIFEAKNRPCAGPPGLSRALARPPGSWIRTTPRLGNVCFFDYNLFWIDNIMFFGIIMLSRVVRLLLRGGVQGGNALHSSIFQKNMEISINLWNFHKFMEIP